jgi:hypothetical protein
MSLSKRQRSLTQDKIINAKMTAIDMSQPNSAVCIDRLDIQWVRSAVLVKVGDVEYAIVSDDNYHFLDPYRKAMYEAPGFVFTPSGPTIAVGGSDRARKVAVGGKLGIIKDPFGATQYLGVTLPPDGSGIISLGVSKDGKVLVGQINGGFSANLFDSMQSKPNQSHTWRVDALIAAALDMPEADRMSKHTSLPGGAEQLIHETALQKIVKRNKTVTFLYAAKDEEHNDAVVIKNFIL